MPSIAHVRANKIENGLVGDILYHETDDQSVVITSENETIPNGVETLDELVDNFGNLAFSNIPVTYNPTTNILEFGTPDPQPSGGEE